MTLEIGSLVIRASFGTEPSDSIAAAQLEERVALAERQLREEVADMIAEALRRRDER